MVVGSNPTGAINPRSSMEPEQATTNRKVTGSNPVGGSERRCGIMNGEDENGEWEDQTVRQTIAHFAQRGGCGSAFIIIPLATILALVAQWIRASAF